ncbi:BirA family biotin operon repressor/biotin-[acetyl-CoA-carboxylase] ligase [Lapillicoccus jejuensis]|uniref:biotin--[biotin carboxyl-carrier protein] ligase n=1 Tax=Lapillicoccus jejuensis TaxID=402171 RepID=A0A542E2C9_9MICO|nr:BirA family biotin operon repressor/biotin-[acetyl-CoA-carboxylase] ligase [Lapillicoccus jejuensis]
MTLALGLVADLVDVDALRASFVTHPPTTAGGSVRWVDVEHHASLPSTNRRALELARPGLVVLADHQSAGRGRLDRGWESPVGASLLLSATVPVPATGTGWLPLLAGLAVARAVREVAGVRAVLKWPNDVLLPADEDRKVCGVLCELGSAPGRAPVVVVGIGVNLTQGSDALPVPTATSLALAGAGSVDPTALAGAVLRHLAVAVDALVAGGDAAAAARASYRGACDTLGREVRLQRTGAPDVVGTAVDLDDDGRLVLETAAGERGAWAAGDVVHARREPVGP